MLSVGLLGPLTFALEGRRFATDLGPHGRLLAGFLFSTPGKIHRRERLAEMFWRHLDGPDKSRGALNTALWRIRKILAAEPASRGGQGLFTSLAEVVLEPADWLDIDIVRFENEANAALAGEQFSDYNARIRALQRVTACYVAPFFEGEDADWVIERRERAHSKYVRLSTGLLHLLAQTGRIADAIDLARQILAYDPFRETVHRDLLTLLVLSGERAEALRTHRRWAATLQRELEVPPTPETERLIEDIRSGQLLADPAHHRACEHLRRPV
jgi:DNA-binding SARP family transcriptional activator